jgi:vacuolar protein sorting-associated protein VTA1
VPSLAVLAEAQKAARSAASSIAFEDVGTAVRFLQEALRLLTVDGASVSNSKKK